MLTQEQIDRYHEDGFVTPDFRLPNDVIDEIKQAHDRLVAEHPEFNDYCSALLAHDTWYLNIARLPEILELSLIHI